MADATPMPKPFPFNDDEIKEYQERMKRLFDEELSFDDAKQRLRELLHLYWILAHRPPKEGESPCTPPPVPWI